MPNLTVFLINHTECSVDGGAARAEVVTVAAIAIRIPGHVAGRALFNSVRESNVVWRREGKCGAGASCLPAYAFVELHSLLNNTPDMYV